MFGRCDITQEIRSRGCRNSSADCRCNMVISRKYIRYKRSKNIKRCIVAYTLLQFHIRRYFIHCHMSRTFHHYLYISCPCSFRESSEFNQFRYLSRICRIIYTARSKCISKTDSYIKFLKYIKHLIIIFIKRIFVACHQHPCKKK